MLCVWLFCALGELAMLKVELFSSASLSIFGLLVFLSVVVGLLQPFSCCYRSVRYSTLRGLFNVAVSPCG